MEYYGSDTIFTKDGSTVKPSLWYDFPPRYRLSRK